jgi:putative glutamine transport system substrate-binding protein
MKKFLLLIGIIMVSSILFSACGSEEEGVEAIKERGTLNVGVKVDVPKFGYKDPETEEITGFEVDIAEKIAEEIIGEPNVNLKAVNAKTRGPMLDNGEVDIVIATFTITEERKKSYNFSEPYFTDGVQLLVKKSDGFESLVDLDGKTIGVAQSSTTKDALQEEAENQSISLEFSEYATYPEIKSALLAGRVDCFSVDGAILAGYVDDDTVILDDKYAEQEYGVAIKKSNDDLNDEVNSIISKMLSSGEIDELIKEWEIK